MIKVINEISYNKPVTGCIKEIIDHILNKNSYKNILSNYKVSTCKVIKSGLLKTKTGTEKHVKEVIDSIYHLGYEFSEEDIKKTITELYKYNEGFFIDNEVYENPAEDNWICRLYSNNLSTSSNKEINFYIDVTNNKEKEERKDLMISFYFEFIKDNDKYG